MILILDFLVWFPHLQEYVRSPSILYAASFFPGSGLEYEDNVHSLMNVQFRIVNNEDCDIYAVIRMIHIYEDVILGDHDMVEWADGWGVD